MIPSTRIHDFACTSYPASAAPRAFPPHDGGCLPTVDIDDAAGKQLLISIFGHHWAR